MHIFSRDYVIFSSGQVAEYGKFVDIKGHKAKIKHYVYHVYYMCKTLRKFDALNFALRLNLKHPQWYIRRQNSVFLLTMIKEYWFQWSLDIEICSCYLYVSKAMKLDIIKPWYKIAIIIAPYSNSLITRIITRFIALDMETGT